MELQTNEIFCQKLLISIYYRIKLVMLGSTSRVTYTHAFFFDVSLFTFQELSSAPFLLNLYVLSLPLALSGFK